MSRLAKCVLAGLVVLMACGSAMAVPGPPVPEVDPSMAAGALTLLSGGLLILTGRRRKKH
jgi:LPXTG-motif cell wall-anchored protein